MENQETRIIRRVLEGDTDSFRHIVDAYSERLFRLVVRIVDRPEDAADVVQDAFVRAYSRLSTFDGRSSLSTWLYTIAARQAISHARSRLRRPDTVDERDLAAISDSCADSLLDSPDDPRLAALPDAIDRLSPDERTLITLHYLEEMSLREVAVVLGITEGNAKVRLLRTRRKLYLLINSLTPQYE